MSRLMSVYVLTWYNILCFPHQCDIRHILGWAGPVWARGSAGVVGALCVRLPCTDGRLAHVAVADDAATTAADGMGAAAREGEELHGGRGKEVSTMGDRRRIGGRGGQCPLYDWTYFDISRESWNTVIVLNPWCAQSIHFKMICVYFDSLITFHYVKNTGIALQKERLFYLKSKNTTTKQRFRSHYTSWSGYIFCQKKGYGKKETEKWL